MFAGLKVSPVSVTALLMRRILSPVRRLNTITKVVSGIVLVTLCAVVAALNVNPLLTIGAIGLATATLYGVIVASGGLEVGELPDRQSRVVPLVTASQTSAGGKALLLEATKSLKIVAGWLGPGIFFNDGVFVACRRIIARGGEVAIIVAEPDRTREQIRDRAKAPALWTEFEGWVRDKKVVFQKTIAPQGPHFAVVDDLHVWDEEPHDPAVLGQKARVIYFDERVNGFNERFRKLQEQSVPF